MALNKGALLPVPFHSALGYHVIQLQDKREVPLPSFDALKPQIQNLAAQRQAQQYMADLMKNAKIAEAAPLEKNPLSNFPLILRRGLLGGLFCQEN